MRKYSGWCAAFTLVWGVLSGCSGSTADEPTNGCFDGACPPPVGQTCAPPATEVSGPDCPEGYACQTISGTLRCKTKIYTIEQCTDAGGIPTANPSNGNLPLAQCPGESALGAIAYWTEGGLCCSTGRRCGARAGNTCTSDEFCAYEPPALCGAADAEASCKRRPVAGCIELYAPVCGCDGKTYDNSCFANAAGTGIYSAGECTN